MTLRPDSDLAGRIHRLSALIHGRYGVDLDVDAGLTWTDGPAPESVAAFLAGHGYDTCHDLAGYTRIITWPDRLFSMLCRHVRPRTVYLAALRAGPGATNRDIAYRLDFDNDGLQPCCAAEEVAVALLDDHLADPSPVAETLAAQTLTVIERLGGRQVLLDTCGLACQN
jgi:hypothetical protein